MNRILRHTPIIGRFLIRYERALIRLQEEQGDTLEEVLKGLDDDQHWQKRREFEDRQRQAFPQNPHEPNWSNHPLA